MANPRNVAVLVGGLRKGSFTRLVANALAALAPPTLHLAQLEIGNLALYDQDADDEKRPPDIWVSFRHSIIASDAVLFVTPEYNRSVPGVLKNAIDIGSRPYGHSVWNGKPAAIVTVTPGAMGGFGANHHLRQSLVFLNMPTMQQPEAYVGGAAELFDADGRLIQEGAKAFFEDVMKRFASWIEVTRPLQELAAE